MVNKLATSLFNAFRGMNIDGTHSSYHFENIGPDDPSNQAILYEARYILKEEESPVAQKSKATKDPKIATFDPADGSAIS